MLEYSDEGNIREYESEDEQATPPVDPPPRELVASDVEDAAQQKEKPDVAELGEECEENDDGVLRQFVKHLSDFDAAAIREHTHAIVEGFERCYSLGQYLLLGVNVS